MSKTATYSLISSQTLGSASATITFSSIPSTYTDLILVCNTFATSSTDYIQVRINSDTGSNYSNTALYGNGTVALSGRVTNQTFGYISYTFYVDSRVTISHFMDYSNTTTYKSYLSRSGLDSQGTDAIVGLWRSTSAITALEIKRTTGGNFNSGSTFKLYGIEAYK